MKIHRKAISSTSISYDVISEHAHFYVATDPATQEDYCLPKSDYEHIVTIPIWRDVTSKCILSDVIHATVGHSEIGTTLNFPDGKLDDSHKLCVIPAGYRLRKVCIPPTHYTEAGFAEPKPKYAFIVEQREGE